MRNLARTFSVVAAASAIGLAVGAGPADAAVRPATVDRTACSDATAGIETDTGLDCFGRGAGSVGLYGVYEIYTNDACITYVLDGATSGLGPDQEYLLIGGTGTITYIDVTGCANT